MSAASLDQLDRLMSAAFFVGRQPRSEQYRQGVRAILAHRLEAAPLPEVPFPIGTPEADAYFSGQNEGRDIARREKGGTS